MAIVFGIEGVPVFELILVVTFLLLAGLIFVVMEVWKLRRLLTEEKDDIKRFEQDLNEFEVDTGKKATPHPELVKKIVDAKDRGISHSQIHTSMHAAGWDKDSIKKVFDHVKSTSSNPAQAPVQAPAPGQSANK